MIYYTETRSVHLVISSGRSMVTGVDFAYINNFAFTLYDHTHRVIEMYFRDKQLTIFCQFWYDSMAPINDLSGQKFERCSRKPRNTMPLWNVGFTYSSQTN